MGKELLGSLQLNRAYQMDCLEGMKLLPDKSIDMILCDLPYGTTACKWDSIIPLDKMWEQYKRIIKENGVIVLTACQPFTTKLISFNLDMFKYCWIWQKPQGVDPFMAKKRPLNNYEDICVFYKKQPNYNPQFTEGKPYKVERDKKPRKYEITDTIMKPTTTVNEGKRYPTRIVKFNQDRGYHPTQKPVALFEYLINTYTNEGDVVLDNCLGSGTTAVASELTKRKWIGFETESKYIEVMNKRLDSIQKEDDLEDYK
ncbi:cytosine methyltransferase [Bacillus pumilus]|uniref:Methyltransferase n=1 Tax=Bacillus pumilus TaxID=1408 RepID=A0A2A5ILG5_BACPU|nr:site-specific DNA-methyltransferase [Bacillus pumilus]PCK18155.1 cytosine methyltransferase [Bacillus pumilus]